MSRLARETDNVGVMLAPAEADVMVISFAHMDFDIGSERFWGEEAIAKAGYAGMGLICRDNSWFPSQDMQQLSSYILQQCRPYQRIALYGFSMGAYAAAKYSRLLHADCAIALSPQFSIDPADVWGNDGRLMRLFRPELNRGMAITEADLAGAVYLFHDPYTAVDRWNCAMIAGRAGPDAEIRLVGVPWIGHETIDVFAGTQLVRDLVRLCLERDMVGLRRLTANSRRRSQRRIFNTLRAVRRRAPARAAALFSRYQAELGPDWRNKWLDL